VSDARLLEYYRELPQLQPPDDPDLWAARMHDALRVYRQQALRWYTEGTLQRLLTHPDPETRRAAVLALGLVGTMDSNGPLARVLHDDDQPAARMAADALWQVWFRGGTEEQNSELQRVLHLPDFLEILAGWTTWPGRTRGSPRCTTSGRSCTSAAATSPGRWPTASGRWN